MRLRGNAVRRTGLTVVTMAAMSTFACFDSAPTASPSKTHDEMSEFSAAGIVYNMIWQPTADGPRLIGSSRGNLQVGQHKGAPPAIFGEVVDQQGEPAAV